MMKTEVTKQGKLEYTPIDKPNKDNIYDIFCADALHILVTTVKNHYAMKNAKGVTNEK